MRRRRCEPTFNASASGLMAAITCFSTGATTQNEPTGQQAENVVVSATRITAAGFKAPTPNTVVSSEFLLPRLCGNRAAMTGS